MKLIKEKSNCRIFEDFSYKIANRIINDSKLKSFVITELNKLDDEIHFKLHDFSKQVTHTLVLELITKTLFKCVDSLSLFNFEYPDNETKVKIEASFTKILNDLYLILKTRLGFMGKESDIDFFDNYFIVANANFEDFSFSNYWKGVQLNFDVFSTIANNQNNIFKLDNNFMLVYSRCSDVISKFKVEFVLNLIDFLKKDNFNFDD